MSVTTHMHGGFANWSAPTYGEVEGAVSHIADFIKYSTSKIHKVDLIIGVSRGGLIPAVMLSHMMNLPMQAVHYSSKTGAGDNKDHKNQLPKFKAKSILIVDDICDSGLTLSEMVSNYTKLGCNVTTAVIYYKKLPEDRTVHVPDVWAVKISENFGWIKFPFEQR